MNTVKLYKLKKGDTFRTLDIHGEPENEIYIKGRPHTDKYDHNRKMFVTLNYAPGKPYHESFSGYMDCDIDVIKVTE